jgi:hypothetical protein
MEISQKLKLFKAVGEKFDKEVIRVLKKNAQMEAS